MEDLTEDPIQELIEMNAELQRRHIDPGVIKKCQKIISLLLQGKVNLNELKEACRQGIPDEAHRLRVYCWMILLDVLPLDTSLWKTTLHDLRICYTRFSQEFLNKQKYTQFPYGERDSKGLPEWEELKEDYLIWEQIEKDTMRTRSELSFFSASYDYQETPFFKTGARREKEKIIRGQSKQQYQQAIKTLDNRVYRYDVMTRVLFVISKFNRKLKYVQGMNEILSPIFYLTNLNHPQPREWECMWILNKMLWDIKELLIQEFDKEDIGIEGKLKSIENKLMVIDYELWARLTKLEIKPFFYAFRWITLYFAQEFQLHDLMLLWDNIFTYQDRQNYCELACISILLSKRNFILNNGFSSVLSCIQDNSQLNVRVIIRKTRQLQQVHKGVDFDHEAKALNDTRQMIDKAFDAAKSIKRQSLWLLGSIRKMVP